MRLLRVFRLVLIDTRCRRDVFRSKSVLDRVPSHRHRLGCHINAIGSHVCNVSGLIKPLSGAHCLPSPHSQFAAGFLLQGRRHEGGGRVAAGGFRFDACHGQVTAGDRLHSHLGLRFVRQIKPVQLLAGQRHQPGFEFLPARRGDQCLDAPVFAVAKGLDLHLALDDQPQCHGLNPARRLCPGQFAPQNR